MGTRTFHFRTQGQRLGERLRSWRGRGEGRRGEEEEEERKEGGMGTEGQRDREGGEERRKKGGRGREGGRKERWGQEGTSSRLPRSSNDELEDACKCSHKQSRIIEETTHQ